VGEIATENRFMSPSGEAWQDKFETLIQDMEEIAGGAFEMWVHGQRPVTASGRYPVNIARLMREGIPPIPMLLDGWLNEGDLHWVASEAEAGKTWLANVLALRVMVEREKRVVCFDEELGKAELTRRLLALGADPDIVQERFVYFSYPGFNFNDDDVADHAAILAQIPDLGLAIYDTATDFITEAGLDEDKGQQVTAWVKAFPEEARKLNVTQLVLDHVGKSSEGSKTNRHAVGSRAKRAKAKVGYTLTIPKGQGYDRDKLGQLVIYRTKNTRGSHIPQERKIELGGDGQGSFVFRDITNDLLSNIQDADDADDAATKVMQTKQRIVDVLRAAGPNGLSKTEINARVPGAKSAILRYIDEMAPSALWPIEVFKLNGKGYDRFRHKDNT
jgi:AAA domain